MTDQAKTVYFADCDQFDNSATGFYATPEDAEAAFWSEQIFSEAEMKRVRVYTVAEEVDEDTLDVARIRADRGSPSPALGIDAA